MRFFCWLLGHDWAWAQNVSFRKRWICRQCGATLADRPTDGRTTLGRLADSLP